MLIDGQEPFEIHPVQPPPPVVVRQFNGPLLMAFLLVTAIILIVLGLVFRKPLDNLTKKGAAEAQYQLLDRQERKGQQATEQDVKILLKKLPEHLQELKKQLYILDTECRSRLGVSLTQLYRHSSSRIDAAIWNSDAFTQSYTEFRNTCVTETDFVDADRVLTRVKHKLTQSSLDDVDQQDLEDLRNWIESKLNTLSGQKILIGKLSEYLKQSV